MSSEEIKFLNSQEITFRYRRRQRVNCQSYSGENGSPGPTFMACIKKPVKPIRRLFSGGGGISHTSAVQPCRCGGTECLEAGVGRPSARKKMRCVAYNAILGQKRRGNQPGPFVSSPRLRGGFLFWQEQHDHRVPILHW